jgi:hypothetical protein
LTLFLELPSPASSSSFPSTKKTTSQSWLLSENSTPTRYVAALLYPLYSNPSIFEADNPSQGNPRSTAIRAVAKANNVDLEIVETEPAKGVSAEYLKLNGLGKVPTFVGADGYTLHECVAIAIYSM